VAPPPIFPSVEPEPATTTGSGKHRERALDAGRSARLLALIATLSSPDREIVLLRVVAGVSIPDIVAALGVTPTAIRLAEHQALGALQPAATANGPPSVTRVQVVLLPRTRPEPTDTRPVNRRVRRVNGMNHDESPRHHPAHSDGTTRAITASRQWHDAELAMKAARHSYERWLVAGHEDIPSLAIMHAHHTRTAVHEAARAIATLIETLGAEATTLTTPARRTDIPTQRR
jgi:hypothetical protein